MAIIKVNTPKEVKDGAEIMFTAPCDSSVVTGLKVIVVAEDGSAEAEHSFTFKDANGNELSTVDNIFKKDAYVKVILSVTKDIAYIQNPDTNGYLEKRLNHTVTEDISVNRLQDTPVGLGSTAIGDDCEASGDYSYAEGEKCIAKAKYQHVQGKYNKPDDDEKYAHIIGGGRHNSRRNIHTIDWQGNAEYAGDVVAQGADAYGDVEPVSLLGLQKQVDESNLLVLYSNLSDEYLNESKFGDEALQAILKGKQILVRVPNADRGKYTAIHSPIIMYHIPRYENKYLYLLYLNDGLDAMGMPSFNQLKMLLSKEYNENPLIDFSPFSITYDINNDALFRVNGEYCYRDKKLPVEPKSEYKAVIDYKNPWGSLEYGVTMNDVDITEDVCEHIPSNSAGTEGKIFINIPEVIGNVSILAQI